MTFYDGLRIRAIPGNGEYEVFDPRWWRLDRWIRWLWVTRVRDVPAGKITINDAGGLRDVRVADTNYAEYPHGMATP